MIYIVFAGLVGIVLFYIVVVKNGKLSFWRLAAKYPDLAYELISQDDNWVIDRDGTFQADSTYTGPFRLYVPQLNQTVKFYCKYNVIEDSQNSISKKIKLLSMTSQ